MLPTNATFALSLLCGIAGGAVQGKAEGRLKKRHPGRFPPSVSEYIGRAYLRWRSGEEGSSLLFGLSNAHAEYAAITLTPSLTPPCSSAFGLSNAHAERAAM